MVEQMQTINTDGIEPMAHPHEAALRLREDEVTETDRAADYQAVAPAVRNRLYIVPQVIDEYSEYASDGISNTARSPLRMEDL